MLISQRERDGEAVIRSASLEGYRKLLLELGVDPQPLLTEAGIGLDVLSCPEVYIPARNYRSALALAARSTGLPHFGLLLSQRQTFEKLGALGYLARHATDLGESIDRLIAHFRTHDTGSMTKLEIDGDTALWAHRLSGLQGESGIQQAELAVGLAVNFIRSALAETWCPTVIYFEHQAPKNIQPYANVFRCQVYFSQTITAMEFPSSDLSRPLRQSDPRLFAILESHLNQVDADLGHDCVQKVRLAVQRALETGTVGVDDVAQQLGWKRHYLQRRLSHAGTSYQKILDEVRAGLARRYLVESKLPIAEISGILGYAESAVFTRAFTRWHGTTPSSWRDKHSH